MPGGLAADAVLSDAGRGGNDHDGELDRLRRQYPRWRIWRGRATGDYWAMPPRDHPALRGLIGAGDVTELARRLAQAEGRPAR
jgi:hypothetical protein